MNEEKRRVRRRKRIVKDWDWNDWGRGGEEQKRGRGYWEEKNRGGKKRKRIGNEMRKR